MNKLNYLALFSTVMLTACGGGSEDTVIMGATPLASGVTSSQPAAQQNIELGQPEVVTPAPEVVTPVPEVVTPAPEVVTPEPEVLTPVGLTESEFRAIFNADQTWAVTMSQSNYLDILEDVGDDTDGQTGTLVTNQFMSRSSTTSEQTGFVTACNGDNIDVAPSYAGLSNNFECPAPSTIMSYNGSTEAINRTTCGNGNYVERRFTRTNGSIYAGQASIDQDYQQRAVNISNLCAHETRTIGSLEDYDRPLFQVENFSFTLVGRDDVTDDEIVIGTSYAGLTSLTPGNYALGDDSEASFPYIGTNRVFVPTNVSIFERASGQLSANVVYQFLDGVTPRLTFNYDLNP